MAHLSGDGPRKLRKLPAFIIKNASHLFSGVIPKPRHVSMPANLAWMPVKEGDVIPTDCDSRLLPTMPLLFGFTRNGHGISSSQECCLTTESGSGHCPEPWPVVKPELCVVHWRMKRSSCMNPSILPIPVPHLPNVLLLWQRDSWSHATVSMFTVFIGCPLARYSSDFRAQHTSELRYLFGTLTPDGYDETDRRIAAWLQVQRASFARDGVSPDVRCWKPLRRESKHYTDSRRPRLGRIVEDRIVRILHKLRTNWHPSHSWFPQHLEEVI